MPENVTALNPAVQASEQALAAVYACLDEGRSFLVEAGAGAGKTYTLVKALQYLLERNKTILPQRHRRIACITFTNVAKDEIEARTDRNPLIYCDTIHGFCWSLIKGFPKQLRTCLPELPKWPELIADIGELGERPIEYDLGYRSLNDQRAALHHDDVLLLTIALMEYVKFRRILTDQYPIILIDEYQDTNAGWIESIKEHFLGEASAPQFGFFGDHWQKIYGDGCGKIEHPSLEVIGKQANFRSVWAVVECLNRMRPELPQFVEDPDAPGSVQVFHTNAWPAARRTGAHWGGDLPADVANDALQQVKDRLTDDGWDFAPESTKILMLTHRVLAAQQGYPSIPTVFSWNDAFTKQEDPHIAYFKEALEPACEAFLAQQYGQMFLALDSRRPALGHLADKQRWSDSMATLIDLRETGTVGDVLDHLLAVGRPRVPPAVEQRENALAQFDPEGDAEFPRSLKELQKLRAVPYQEIIALCRFLSGHSPFETKHGVKGAQFENVLVVVGRGWSRYNFSEMLELAHDPANIPHGRLEAFERNRNLFYVTCSRPQRHLAILFTQQLSAAALGTAAAWFGDDRIEALDPPT